MSDHNPTPAPIDAEPGETIPPELEEDDPPFSTRFTDETSSDPWDITNFNPMPRRARHDGWTVERQREFIAALAECGCVTEAAGRVGMDPRGAYRLRRDPMSTGFRKAWETALQFSTKRLAEECMARAIHGTVVPHYYKGEKIGEHRRYNDRLAMFMLRTRNREEFGSREEQSKVSGTELYAPMLERDIIDIKPGELTSTERVLKKNLIVQMQSAIENLQAKLKQIEAQQRG